MPIRTLVVWSPDWSVIAAEATPDEPVAVVKANRLTSCSPAAHREGVRVGQRRREAQGRCPALVLHDHDEARDARRFEPVMRALEQFTPRIELTRPGACAFPTRGPSRYFGGDARLVERVRVATDSVLAELGWVGHVRVGVADGPFAAMLAARQGRVVPAGGSAAFLAPFAIGALERPDLVDVLERLGLRTLGAFADLDPADVAARFGAEGANAHRLARGLDERPPAPSAPPPDLVVTAELDPPAERVDTAAFVAKSLADDLHHQLDRRGLSCTRVLILAETEHGERHERCWRHEGALSAGAVADRVRWQLDGWLNGSVALRPTAGIDRLTLVPDEVVPARGRQLGFWGGETASADRVARAVARVQGLVGVDAVVVPEWRGGRSPGERFALVSAAAVDLTSRALTPAGTVESPWPGQVPAPSPATVLSTPVPTEVCGDDGRPMVIDGRVQTNTVPAQMRVGEGPWLAVEAWAGPWPADERWWDPASRRRRARLQVVAGGRAHLVVLEGGRWWLEAIYD
jgi:protein ImuB